MHTRRLGAFLIGAWLIGSVLVWLTQSQTVMTVDRLLTSPPAQAAGQLETMGSDASRQMLRHVAMQVNRRVGETWEVVQLGLGAALLASSILTPHRSRITIGCAALMMALSATMAFYLTPRMNELGRTLDFVSPAAAPEERAALNNLEVWYKTAEVLKTMLALVVSIRLLFDFYEFRSKLQEEPAARRRRSAVSRKSTLASGAASLEASRRPGTESGN